MEYQFIALITQCYIHDFHKLSSERRHDQLSSFQMDLRVPESVFMRLKL